MSPNCKLVRIFILSFPVIVIAMTTFTTRADEINQYGKMYTICGSLGQNEYWSNEMYYRKKHWVHYYELYLKNAIKIDTPINGMIPSFHGKYIAIFPKNNKIRIPSLMLHKFICVLGKISPIYVAWPTFSAYVRITKIWLVKKYN